MTGTPVNIAEEIAWRLEGAYRSLPSDQQKTYNDLAEELWPLLLADDDLHEGCAPAEMHDLPSCDRSLLEHAAAEGYERACDDVLERLERLTGVLGDPALAELRAIVARISGGVQRLKARGPDE